MFKIIDFPYMIHIYNNLVGYNQEVSCRWLNVGIFLAIISYIFTNNFNLMLSLLLITLGMNIIANITSKKFDFINKVVCLTSWLGAMLCIIFALIADEKQVINSFFPIYNNLLYILGISLFFAGVFTQSLILLIDKEKFSFKNFDAICLAIIMILAEISVFVSFYKIKDSLVGNIAFDYQEFYNAIFRTKFIILDFFYVQVIALCVNYILQKFLYKKEILAIKNRLDYLSIKINIIGVLIFFEATYSFLKLF